MSIKPTTKQFEREVLARLAQARADNVEFVDLAAREIHDRIGGYVPGQKSDHRFAPLGRTMRRLMQPGDEILEGSPALGNGANLRVRYRIRGRRENVAEGQVVRASDQHHLARQILEVIGKLALEGTLTRYGDVAEALDRPRTDARAVAQACNLLDSAATHARRPLMALWTVRDRDWEINDAAWRTDTVPELREAIIEEARQHRFTADDKAAIIASLPELRGLGAQKAWERMREEVPHNVMMDRLIAREPSTPDDSLNDLDIGSDVPHSVPSSGRRFVRDHRVRAAVLARAGGRCEFCDEPGFRTAAGTVYLEAHHILALSKDGQDRPTNVIALCPLDHRRAHLAEDRKKLEQRMVRIVRDKERA